MARSLKPGSLCKLSKGDIDKHFDELADITCKSRFLCRKCARSAQDKKWLCKPQKTEP